MMPNMTSTTIIIAITFIVYILIVLGIGLYAGQQTKDLSDYILGGRHLSGPIVALGAGASDMSSWLLMALPGAVLVFGLNQLWLPLGLSIGAYLNWKYVAQRLRVYSEKANNALTLPAFLAGRFPHHKKTIRAVTAIVIIIFFTFYTSASFVAGAYLLQLIFHMPYQWAVFASAGIIIFYTAIGGFFAISWIDFFQGCLMFVSLLVVPAVAFRHMGTWTHALPELLAKHPGYFNPFSHFSLISALSLLAWGFGYFGQPHILVRFMAARDHRELPMARMICMLWMGIALGGAVLTGIAGASFFLHSPIKNSEEIFLKLSYILFNPWIAGILLSAVISAIMSTASAQLLASASALIEDVYHPFVKPSASKKYLMVGARLSVLFVAGMAYWLATDPKGNLLALVAYAWSGLGASFGPVILLSLFWKRLTANAAIAGLIVGGATVIIWEILGHHVGGFFKLYSIIPGFFLNLLVLVVVSLKDTPPAESVQALFDEVSQCFK